MNYLKIYDDLIERARNRVLDGYNEKHHILPKCIGGDDSFENIVELLPEEHYLAHQLLVKIHPSVNSLIYAANMMTVGRGGNKRYSWLKRRWISSLKGKVLSEETKEKISKKAKKRIKEKGHPKGMQGKRHSDKTKICMSKKRSGESNWMFGKTHSEEVRKKMRKPKSEEHKRKLSEQKRGVNHPNYGKALSINTKKKISLGVKKSKSVKCPHCSKVGKVSPMHRWHFDNCKEREDG